MSRLIRLEKLEPVVHDRWVASWNAYMDRVLNRLPETVEARLAGGWPEEYDERQFSEFGLEPQAWKTWHEKVRAATPINLEFNNSFYLLTPEGIPQPPFSPDRELEAAEGWTYPQTLEGGSRAYIALVMAQAVEVASMR